MATSNNPRKFSEKIALHNQKQAEETAAFEEVMKDLSITRAARLQLQKTQYLQLGQNRGQYYGGSLPNVNQIRNSEVDLPFQTPFPNSAVDSSRTSRHHGLVDRVYRERSRMTSPHRRPLDKHDHIDSCPYGSVYLSPPPDTSWRRTNSDSALHQSTLNPTPQDAFAGGPQSLQPKRVLLLTVPGTDMTDSQVDEDGQEQIWDSKKVRCHLIFPSPDQDISSSLIPVTHNTGDSLPDLTNIQFPPPLPMPLDPEDTASTLSSSNSGGNIASSGATSSQPTAVAGRRPEDMVPLILSADVHQHQALQQLSPTLSPPITLTQAVTLDTMTLEQQLAQYPFFSQTSSQPATQVVGGGLHPGTHSSILGSVFGDFYDQQLSSRQTSALSQQLEQFNMMENPVSSSSLYSQGSTLNYSQAAMLELTGSHGNLQDAQQLGYSSHGNIPNIILTDDSFDADSQFPLDELKIDPLTLDGLHMLNDPDMVLADPATEDAFRLDRL
uniref:Uncharacterized protein n=1 Tax=Denticeps clupeoides TaxID=299321 RepID=A0AAY4AMR0_9TELE